MAAELTVAVLLVWSLSPTERDALLGACTRAFGQGTCAIAAEAGEAEVSAEVRQEASCAISVEIGLGGDRVHHVLRFGEADSLLERAKAVGLTTGVLAGELIHRQTMAGSRADRGTSGVGPGADGPAAADASQAYRYDAFASAQLGVGWEDGLRAAEPGAALRVGLRSGGSWFGVALDESWLAPAGSELRVRKGHAALWVGMSRPWGAFEIGGAIELGAQWLRVATPAPLPADNAARLIPMARLSASATYWVGTWGVAVTGRASWLSSSTTLFLRDEVVAETSRLGLTGLIGPVLRWRLFDE